MGKLEGKVAVITGGASGIGAATVRLFLEEGAKVVLADILDEPAKALVEELGGNLAFIHTDVTQETAIKAAIDLAVEKFGRLDVMYNNAGFPGAGGPITEMEAEAFDQTIAVLLRGPFLGIKQAGAIMQKQGFGSIISTASVAGLRTGMAGHAYSAAKAGVIHLTRTAAMELGEKGVRVNCICPGGIATPIFGKAMGLSNEDAAKTVEIMKLALAQIQPIKRAGLPEDIAKAALWLASDDSSFVNGHALVVDGGLIGGRTWTETEFSQEQMKMLMTQTLQEMQ